MAEGFEIAAAFVRVSPDLDGFEEELKTKLDAAVEGATANAKVGLDTSELDAKAQEAKAKVGELDETTATAKIGADSGELDDTVDDAKAKVGEFDETTATAKIGGDATELDGTVDDAKSKVDEVSSKKGTAKITADDAAADATIKALQLQLRILTLQKNDVEISANATEAEVKIAELRSQIIALNAEAAGAGESGGFEMPGGMMGGLAAGLAALSPGIGGAATGLGLLGGTGFLAFDGIAKALESANQSAQNVGMTGAQVAEQQFSNSVAVQQAQQSISQAQAQAAMTERDAAASQVQALEQVTQAQQGVQEADYNSTEATYNYGQALVQARENIVSLNDALADQKLNVEQAGLAIQQAEYQQTLTNENAYSTDLDREQAALAVAQAKQQLKDSTDQESDAQTAANLANQQGVNGSQTVIQAKEQVTQAQYEQTNATNALKDAQSNLTKTQLDNATQVKLAQEAVTQAQKNLTNTIKEQALEWQAEQSTSNSAANQFAKDMSLLTPAGQGFVKAILALKPAWKELEGIAQNTVLPGMTIFLSGIKSLLPEISGGVKEMGGAISQAFGAFGKQMETPAFAKTLDGLITNGVKFANVVLPAFAQFIQQLAISGGKKGAVDGLASALSGIANAMTGLVRGITPYEGPINKVFGVLAKALASLGGPVGQVIGSLASAIAPALQALLPGFEQLVAAAGSGLSKALIGLAPLLVPVARAITMVAEAVAPVLPQFGQLIGKLGAELVPVLVALLPSVSTLAQLMAGPLGSSVVQIDGALIALLQPVASLILAFAPLINGFTAIVGWLVNMLVQGLQPLIGGMTDTSKGVQLFESQFARSLGQVKQIALDVWHNVLDPMWQGIYDGAKWLVGALPGAWGKIESVFKVPVNFLIGTVYDKGIARFWNDVVGAVGLSSLDMPTIATLSGGGVIPGYAPGRDTQPALLSKGEAVLTPDATRAIGGAGTVNALNSAYPPGGSSKSGGGIGGMLAKEAVRHLVERPAEHAATLGKFSGGGIVGDITGGLSSAWDSATSAVSGLWDAGKAAAALASGNTTAFINALGPGIIGTPAAGNLAKIMTGIPKTLLGDMVSAASRLLGGGSGSGVSGGGVTAQVKSWYEQALKLTGAPQSWLSPLETIGRHESGYNPQAVNNTPAGIAAGLPEGVMQTIMSTFLSYHQPGTSMSIFDPVANISAAIRYIRAVYGNPDDTPGLLALSQGKQYTGYDSGGWLMPGGSVPINQTGQPEAVLTPEESAAWVALVKQMLAQQGAGTGGQAGVTLVFNGPQMPGQEQMAEIMRQVSLAAGV